MPKASADTPVVSDDIHARIEGSRSSGRPLDSSVRGFMEPRFGLDFSAVRVHDCPESARLSRDLNAHAFTVGSDVYFNEGKYAPSTSEGRMLLAHELTHVAQQGWAMRMVRRQTAPAPVPAPVSEEETRRQAIITEAGNQIGQHYIWGGRGDVPSSFSSPHVYTNSHCECAGKHARVTLPHAPAGPPPADFAAYSWKRHEGGSPCGGSGCHASPGDEIWGEACDGKRHFDCGGFVSWCYRIAGKPMSPLSLVTRENLKIGDVCARPGHVALYAGNDEVIHSQSHSSGVVRSAMRGFTEYRNYFPAQQSAAPQPSTPQVRKKQYIQSKKGANAVNQA